MTVQRVFLAGLVSLVIAAGCARPAGSGGATAGAGLKDGTWVLRVDRVWDRGLAGARLPADGLQESDYKSVAKGPTYAVVVSGQGSLVSIGAQPIKGVRKATGESRTVYDLTESTFAGGRFAVWPGKNGLEAELTFFGSGVPVLKSERGTLKPK